MSLSRLHQPESVVPLSGRRYWRSIEELAASPDAPAVLAQEYPSQAALLSDPASRRDFLRLMGASLALAGVTACTRQPTETVIPYVRGPEDLVPGKPLFFATALTLGGFAEGVLVESHMGRPTKIEGNPSHPSSLGGSDAMGQAAILGLYDPDRSKAPRQGATLQTWKAALEALRGVAHQARSRQGQGLWILTGTTTSPTFAALMSRLQDELPQMRWVQFDSLTRDAVRKGAVMALGRHAHTRLLVARADVIVSIDADFLTSGPGHLRHARDLAQRRRVGLTAEAMNRLYVVESSPSLTGAAADHRLPLRPSEIESFARALGAGLGMPIETPSAFGPQSAHGPFVAALVRDLKRHAGASLVVPGDGLPAEVHALVHAINHHLGNTGRTLVYTDPIEARPREQLADLHDLAREMGDGRVESLLILGANPVYEAPAELAFGERLAQVKTSVHLGLYDDETAELCEWHLPETHVLESWGDARAEDGTATIQQPLIAPLYGGRAALEVLSVLVGDGAETSGHDLVRAHWRAQHGSDATFDAFWRRSLHDGVVPESRYPELALTVQGGDWARSVARPAETRGLEIAFRGDAAVHDGRFANNGWLQELPRPLTKLTWDNAALVGPTTALAQGIQSGDLVRVAHSARAIKIPAWVLPGHPEGVITLHLGYGRRRAGQVGNGVGVDVGAVRTSDAWWSGSGAVIETTAEKTSLACTQDHWSMEGRDIVRAATLSEYRQDPHLGSHHGRAHEGAEPSMLPPRTYEGHAWGMAIDLSACTGCNACVVACQSENNVPVVGKDQVARGREMHWIRIDRYYEGSPHDPQAFHQPVPCMHCENAPCETVCPVAATVHSDEGLNDQVYNRCVGTRYCSNNCPYKVRRFNFYLYQDWETPSLKAMRNPDVTVRSRGVMEKCTYCVQRINQARIEARKAGRPIQDGEVRTACQAVCPSQAIVFGDVNDPESEVSRWKAQPRNYGLLAELGTRPRTTYLASVRNPNPELDASRKG